MSIAKRLIQKEIRAHKTSIKTSEQVLKVKGISKINRSINTMKLTMCKKCIKELESDLKKL